MSDDDLYTLPSCASSEANKGSTGEGSPTGPASGAPPLETDSCGQWSLVGDRGGSFCTVCVHRATIEQREGAWLERALYPAVVRTIGRYNRSASRGGGRRWGSAVLTGGNITRNAPPIVKAGACRSWAVRA